MAPSGAPVIFSIINPSDPYTLDCDDRMVAAVAICLLGEGQYGLRQCDGAGDFAVGPFPVGGHETFFLRHFGRTFVDAVNVVDTEHLPALVEALGSVLIGDLEDRREAMQTVRDLPEAERVAWLQAWHDKRRSSANDIGRRAWSISNMLADKLKARAH